MEELAHPQQMEMARPLVEVAMGLVPTSKPLHHSEKERSNMAFPPDMLSKMKGMKKPPTKAKPGKKAPPFGFGKQM